MESLVGIDKDNLSSFLENFVDTGVKVIDELDLFKDDGLVASVPYGKLVGYIAKKLIAIKDPNEALRKLIASSHAICLFKGMEKYNLSLKINKKIFSEKLKATKQKLADFDVDANHFDIDHFFQNDIVKFYSEQIDSLFAESFEMHEKTKLKSFRNDYLKIYFYQFLENQETVYTNLNTLFKSQSHEQVKKLNQKEVYRNDLKNLFNDIVLNDEKGMTLADVYVEPTFRVHISCIKDVKEDNHQAFSDTDGESIHDFIYRHLQVDLPKKFSCTTPNLFFILGYPGQGKSSFCKKMLNDVYSEKNPLNQEIHFIKFRNITNSTELINNPIQTLFDYWKEEYGFQHVEKDEFKKAILILDGLDELFMKENLQNNSIDEFCRILIHQLESPNSPKVIITSRYGYVNIDRIKNNKSLILRLEEFDLERQIRWLEGYQVFHSETTMTIDKLTIYNTNPLFDSIKELITQPILLHMIVTLNQEVTNEMNRAIIYNNIFDSLINRKWAKEGQIEILQGLKKEDLRNFLRDIAFAIFVSGREYIHKSKLIELPETKKFINKLVIKERVQDVLKNIMVAFYFQETKKKEGDFDSIDKSDYAIEFLHKSLQEYLVAEKIWEELLYFTDKEQRRGTFIVDDAKVALERLNEVFQDQLLTKEIMKSFSEIVSQKDFNERETLSQRFEKFLPEWLENGFVLEHKWKDLPINLKEQILFRNFWFILNQLIIGKDYLVNIPSNLFGFFTEKRYQINWCSQTFHGNLRLRKNSKLNAEFPDYYPPIIRNFDLLSVGLDEPTNTQLMNIKIKNLMMQECRVLIFPEGSFHIEESYFINGALYLTNLEQRVVSSIFAGAKIEIRECNLEHSKFYECTIEISKHNRIENIIINDCYFFQCIFYVQNDFDLNFFNDEKIFDNCAKIVRKPNEDKTIGFFGFF